MSKQGQQGSSLVSQQGLAKSSNESTNINDSLKEHPSSSAQFGDKKEFFEKLSSKTDEQVQQGSDNTSKDVEEQGSSRNISQQATSSSSDLKQSSGSSDLKEGSSISQQGSSDSKQESSLKEHPSSSAPFGDKKEFFEKLSSKTDEQVQQGNTGTSKDVGEQGSSSNISQQATSSSSDLKQSSGSSDLKEGSSISQQVSSDSKQESSLKEHPSSSAPFGDKKEFFEKLSSKTDEQVQQGSDNTSKDVGEQGSSRNISQQATTSSSELKQSSGSSDLKEGSSISQQGSTDLKQESSLEEHPSSTAPFGDKKEFFEKLSSKTDEQVQQGSDNTSKDVEEQGSSRNISQQATSSSSDLKQSSGSSDLKEGSSISQQGSSDSKQESSLKEHPSSSAPFGDKKEFFELSSKTDEQVQQGSDNTSKDVGEQGSSRNISQQATTSSSELKQSSGSSDLKEGSSISQQGSYDWKDSKSSGFDKDTFDKQDEGSSFEQKGLISQQGLNWQGPHESEHSKHGNDWDTSTGSSDLKEGSSTNISQQGSYDWKDSKSSGFDKDTFEKQDEGSSFESNINWQGASNESEWNDFGKKGTSELKQSSETTHLKGSSSYIKGKDVEKKSGSVDKGSKDSNLIDFGSESKQESSSTGPSDLSAEISNLKIDSSSSIGQTKKQSVETGPFYDDKVHDDRNDTK